MIGLALGIANYEIDMNNRYENPDPSKIPDAM